MPSPKKCAAKFPKGSKAYNDCVNYKMGPKKSGAKKARKGY
jgi:hypothetical protein